MGIPAKRGSSRVFIIEGGARPDHEPQYKSCWVAGSADHSLGDSERIECPSPNSYNQWEEVGEIQGSDERPTGSLTGVYPIDRESDMRRIAQKRCEVDIQIHMGRCTDPRLFNDCEKAVIFEGGKLSNYSTTELGAISSGDQAKIDESSDFSGKRFYEALPITVVERGASTVVNPVVDVVICDNPSCGDCEEESDGCQTIYAVDDGATGSPGTAPDLLYSTDKAASWAAEDINSLASGEPATGVACLDKYVVVISNTSNSLHYKEKDDVGTAGGWTEETTGFVAACEPNNIWGVGNYAFIVADSGYVYGTSDPTNGVTVLDAGDAVTDDLYGVHALDEYFAVAVGDNGSVIFTNNKTNWDAAIGTPGDGTQDLKCVWIVSEKEWWVGGTADGSSDVLWYTLDGGVTWTAKDLRGTAWTTVYDIAFASNSVGRLVADKSGTPRAYIAETWNGGYDWVLLHRSGAGDIPATDLLYALSVCEHDVNFVVAVGLADDGSDGVILAGED